jgi:hypothetical protein
MSSLPGLATDLKGIAAEMTARHPRLRRHVERAVALLERKGLWLDATCPLSESAYIARSSDGTREYQVLAGHCSCEAGLRGRLCYHRVARRIKEVAYERQRAALFAEEADAQPEEEPAPCPTSDTPPHRPIPDVTRWRWVAGRLPKRKTIRQDQAEMGAHLRRQALSVPLGATIH